MYYIRLPHFQNFTSKMKTTRQRRRGRSLDLNGHLRLSSALKEQIDLSAIFSSVEVGCAPVSGSSDQVFDDETFPTGTCDRMPEQVLERVDVQQRMCKAAVADVDFGFAHEPLADIACPGSQAAHQQQIHEQIEVAPNSR